LETCSVASNELSASIERALSDHLVEQFIVSSLVGDCLGVNTGATGLREPLVENELLIKLG
jgi:hypothetical protein